MAENLVQYTIGIDFDTAIKKMEKFQKMMTNFEQKEARQSVAKQKLMNAHAMERERHLNREYNLQIKKEKELQRVAQRPANAHVKAREKEMDRLARMEARRQTGLTQAQTTFGRSSLNLRTYQARSVNATAQQELRRAVAAAKTADEVRLLVAKERERLRVMKEQERSLNKQNFLMQRMTASSKQFAGNMVSAFAVAGLTAGITRVGQDFESVNNTLLAVSSSAQEAGNNFQFVRDESYRLGLSLADSGKNFAKMLSARGNMSLEDTKNSFRAVSEMSTLLGLSSAESTRAKRLWLL